MITKISFFIIGLFISAAFFNYNMLWPKYNNGLYRFNNSSNYEKTLFNFENISTKIIEDSNADLFYIWLFHERSEVRWYSNLINNSTPGYASAIYIKSKPDIPNPIQERQNMPLLSITNIDITLSGGCTSFVTAVSHSSNSPALHSNRLQVRCALLDDKSQVIGAFGISIVLAQDLTDGLLSSKVPEFTEILLSYKNRLEINFH